MRHVVSDIIYRTVLLGILCCAGFQVEAQQTGLPPQIMPPNITQSLGKMPAGLTEKIDAVRECAAKQGVDIPAIDAPMQKPLDLPEDKKAIVDACMEASGLKQAAVKVDKNGVPVGFAEKYDRIRACAAARGLTMPAYGQPMPKLTKEQESVLSACSTDIGGQAASAPVLVDPEHLLRIKKCAADQGVKLPEVGPAQPTAALTQQQSDVLTACYQKTATAR